MPARQVGGIDFILFSGSGTDVSQLKIDVAGKGLKVGVIIGIVVGVLAIIGIVVFLIIRKRN